MEIGKLPNDVLEKIVFSSIKNKRKEVLVRAGVGEDNAIIDFGDDVCVASTDPITGTTKDIGSLAIYISCNDVASSGAEPIGVLMTIMAPPQTTEEDIRRIMEEAGRASQELNVEIVGGHTEITDAVNRVVVSTTVIGKQPKNKVIDSKKTKIGDKVLITKYVGIEGTSIIAKELEESLKERLPKELLHEALSLNKYISVAKEGVICGEIGVTYMHDVTEGGVFGAVWEASRVINKGIKIKKAAIPMKESTRAISELLGIDPYRLISSGSMLAIASEANILNIQEKLAQAGIESSVIGEVIEKGIYLDTKKGIFEIAPPASDELYKALQR